MIIVTLGDRIIGILADAVSDILTLDESELLPVPAMGCAAGLRFLSGLGLP